MKIKGIHLKQFHDLKSDYYRIEIDFQRVLCMPCYGLKSDYYRIEIGFS